MSRAHRAGLVVAVVVALGLGTGLIAALSGPPDQPLGGQAAAESPSTERAITVSGEGRVLLAPDTAQVTLGVESINPDLATAQQDVNQRMDVVLKAIRDQGVPEERIRTTNYTISPQRDWEKPDSPITGYQVSHLVQVKVQPMDTIGDVIDAAVGAGANAVYDVVMTVEDQSAAVRQAREQAMNDARVKAQHLGQLAGVNLGPPISISETTSSPPPPVPVAGRDAALAAGAGAADIQPGQSEVVLTVTVSYAIQ